MGNILTKKKRLNMAFQLMPKDLYCYFDLFCDHGLLGLHMRENSLAQVFFNDKRGALLREINEKYGIGEEHLLDCPAENISFPSSSGLFLLGVGGILMAEVLKSWHERSQLHPDQYFVLGPNYYEFHLRQTLKELNFQLIKRSFVWEKGQGYELFLVRWQEDCDQELWQNFDHEFWRGCLGEDPHAETYLRQKYKSWLKKRQISEVERAYKEEMGTFLDQLVKKAPAT